jgi:hypothetical protein
MNDPNFTPLLLALEIAAFRRGADGSFSSMAPPPPWFPRLAEDGTFPFLGHILEEANEFWQSGTPGSRAFGPCAEVDESGREFHYQVRAITSWDGRSQYLVFELDAASDQLREALQRAREQLLVTERNRRTVGEIRHAGRELSELIEQFSSAAPDRQPDLIESLRSKCDALMTSVDRLID